jgi:CRP-like cAMP-binding protein
MQTKNQILEIFRATNRLQTFPKGSIIIHQGGNLEYTYYILEGMVKISDIDSRGESRTMSVFANHHVFPISWLLTEQPEEGATYDYEALSDLKCLVLPRPRLREYLKSNPSICCRLIDILVRSYINAGARITNLQKTNVAERIEFVLYYLAVLLGNKTEEGFIEINTSLTHQEISDLAGISRETVSRQLTKKKYNDIFWKKGSKSYVDLQKLEVDKMPKVYPLSV